jgi:hypothetical protein
MANLIPPYKVKIPQDFCAIPDFQLFSALLIFSGVHRLDLRFLSGSEVRHLRAEKFQPRVLVLFREVHKRQPFWQESHGSGFIVFAGCPVGRG